MIVFTCNSIECISGNVHDQSRHLQWLIFHGVDIVEWEVEWVVTASQTVGSQALYTVI